MSDEEIGPALPPHMLEALKEKVSRPKRDNKEDIAPAPKRRRVVGPSFEDLVAEPVPAASEPIIGPPPPDQLDNLCPVSTEEDIDQEWERVMKKPDFNPKQTREDWMLSLPSGPRAQKIQNKSQKTFAKNAVQDLDDSWTNSPQGSSIGPISSRSKASQRPNTRELSAPKKSAGPSLLELHQQKIKVKEQQTPNSEPKRWNRERDLLGVGKSMSRSNREKIINEAANLHSRFASSS